VRCPACDRELPAAARFCPQCGAPAGACCAACGTELPESAERDEVRATATSRLIFFSAPMGSPPAELSELFAEASEDARRRGDELGLAELGSTYGWSLAMVGM